MQSRMTIKYISYGKIEDTTIYRILKYFLTPRKNTLFRLDTDSGKFSLDEVDVFIPSLGISKLEYFDPKGKSSHAYYVTFLCDNHEQVALFKLLYNISVLGDPGHSFRIDFGNDQKCSWDGDGSDRIEEINFIKDWKRDEKSEYLPDCGTLIVKVLNYDRSMDELTSRLSELDRESPLWDNKVREELAAKIAKRISDVQYEKFLEIKDGQDNDGEQ